MNDKQIEKDEVAEFGWADSHGKTPANSERKPPEATYGPNAKGARKAKDAEEKPSDK